MFAGPSCRGRWRWPAVGCLVVAFTALLTASTPSGEAAVRRRVAVLQMNLCNSGIASCYTGRSVAAAATLIRADAPDVVTLNEVCRDDVATLRPALSAGRPGTVVSAFQAAVDRRTGHAFRCRNGAPYGIGLLARIGPPYRAYVTVAGVYPIQDTGDPEERAWLCLRVVRDFSTCTTHLASTDPVVALAQCRYLLGTSLPALGGGDRRPPTVLGGDLNLRPGRPPDIRSCVPKGYARLDDGGTQDVLASAGFAVASRRTINMNGVTDHPSLLVTLNVSVAP
jgi:endonuclease/exonuclease/phosphatase family metal-dependent hydrolase